MTDSPDMTVRKAVYYLPLSAEAVQDAASISAAWDRWWDATPEQREQWAREAAERREFERASTPPAPLSLDALLDKLGWSLEYAHHFVQPYCTCDPSDRDGFYSCPHADDLGISP